VPFVATCLHCRASKFRVPSKKRGTFMTCPKCSHDFMLVPTGSDVPLVDYRPVELDDDADESVEPPARDESPTEPQAIETAETQPVEQPPLPTPTTEPVVVASAPPPATDYALRTALVGLGFFGASMIASQFPYGRWVAAPLAVIGFIIAGLSLLGLEKLRAVGWAGVGLNGLAFLLVVAFPAWLGLSGWTPASDPETAPKPVTAVGRDGSLPKAADWVDAGQAVWEQGDTRVAVTTVSVGSLDATGGVKPPEKKKERALRIGLKITNVGVARAIPFAGWSVPPAAEPKLTTAGGVAVKPLPSPAEKAMVYPGKSVETVLLFVPPEKPDDLRLELPAEAFGGTDPVRVTIPKAMIGGR
jgi:hypothetical protein